MPFHHRFRPEGFKINQSKRLKATLRSSELVCFSRGIIDLTIGDVVGALYIFQRGLLPTASSRGVAWHLSTLYWCALFSVYAGDPWSALEYVDQAEKLPPVDPLWDIRMVKGMALRLSGQIDAAIEVFHNLADPSSGLDPFERDTAQAWLLECQAAVCPKEIDVEWIVWLIEWYYMDIHHQRSCILIAALYRFLVSAELAVKDYPEPEDALLELDKAPLFERPMLSMLLQDILPRPLKGIDEGKDKPVNKRTSR